MNAKLNIQTANKIKHRICQEYGYRSWSDCRTNGTKDDIQAILHEVINEILDNAKLKEE
jgi:hypothetical protein